MNKSARVREAFKTRGSISRQELVETIPELTRGNVDSIIYQMKKKGWEFTTSVADDGSELLTVTQEGSDFDNTRGPSKSKMSNTRLPEIGSSLRVSAFVIKEDETIISLRDEDDRSFFVELRAEALF